MWHNKKQIPAGGGQGGTAGLCSSVADRTTWVKEVHRSRQDIYFINVSVCVCVCVCVCVFERQWSGIISIHSFQFSMASHMQPHLFSWSTVQGQCYCFSRFKLTEIKEEAIELIVLHNYHHTSKLQYLDIFAQNIKRKTKKTPPKPL